MRIGDFPLPGEWTLVTAAAALIERADATHMQFVTVPVIFSNVNLSNLRTN
jgi:hypothetical protein